MAPANPAFLARIPLAFSVFFRILFDAQFAARVRRAGEADALAAPPPPVASPPLLRESDPDAALQVLALLQREGRFVDFIEEDVSRYSDADIGAAARVVHDGCRKAIREHFRLAPVREEAEDSPVVLHQDFDAAAVHLTGHVVGSPPFRGRLTHRGWRVTEVHLPKLTGRHDAYILAPAEVEL
ncbi:MAG: DUF2760 domain-containing protein [Betaproteobacteria bacterium]|nr:DUF2760 domain-containing protein [Betaproteobacteria bacterium]